MNTPEPTRRWGRRHLVVLFCLLAMLLAYTDRVNLSVAVVAMKPQFGWSETVKGFVLAAFFAGFIVFQIASGTLARRFGGKRVLGFAVAWWSVFTLITPLAASISVAALIAARIGLGLGEAAVLPASYDLFSRWVPLGERGRAIGRLLGGIPLGQIAGFGVTGFLVARAAWPTAFYLFGGLGLVWALAFLATVHNDPATDRAVSAAERRLLPPSDRGRPAGLPWRLLLRTPLVLAFIVAHFCHNWALYVLVSWLPSYFHEQQGLGIAQAGLYSAAPWVTNFVALLIGGSAGDRLIARGATVLSVRRLIAVAGLSGAAICLLLLRDAATPQLALWLTCAATFSLGLAASGFTSVPLDITPRHAPVLVGVSNTIATIPGIAGVAITGWLLDLTHSYAATFFSSAAVALLGAIALAVVSNARIPQALAG